MKFKLCTMLVLLCLCFAQVSLASTGAVNLDVYSFDKLVKLFKFSLIKFDIPFPYGEKHETFGKVSESLKNNEDILIGEVGIQDFGDFENKDLADRFNLKKSDFPILLLFDQKDLKNPKKFPSTESFTEDKIKQFVRKETGIKTLLANCLPEFDTLAEQFLELKHSKEEQKKILEKTIEKIDTLSDLKQKSGKIYVKIMEKVLEKGLNFISSETDRVSKLLKTKMSATKTVDLERRLNILQSFKLDRKSNDEL